MRLTRLTGLGVALALTLYIETALADKYDDTILLFKQAGQSASFFDSSYGYAVFPTIGKGGLGIGAAHGSGRVYQQGRYVGDTSMTQISVGFQAGGQSFSQVIFFQDQRAFDEFTSGGIRIRRYGRRRGDHGVRARIDRNGGFQRRGKRRKERCSYRGWVSQGDGRVHDRQGRRNVPSDGGRPKILL